MVLTSEHKSVHELLSRPLGVGWFLRDSPQNEMSVFMAVRKQHSSRFAASVWFFTISTLKRLVNAFDNPPQVVGMSMPVIADNSSFSTTCRSCFPFDLTTYSSTKSSAIFCSCFSASCSRSFDAFCFFADGDPLLGAL